MADFQISPAGIALVKQFEGCSLTVYTDPAGFSTIGTGHKVLPGETWAAEGITQAQADQLLQDDLAVPQDAVNRLADPSCNQNQFDALCDFCFNLGEGALTTMLGHGWDQVPMQMVRWDMAAGKVLEGLERRRQAEAALFTS
jgi:lysozyme